MLIFFLLAYQFKAQRISYMHRQLFKYSLFRVGPQDWLPVYPHFLSTHCLSLLSNLFIPHNAALSERKRYAPRLEGMCVCTLLVEGPTSGPKQGECYQLQIQVDKPQQSSMICLGNTYYISPLVLSSYVVLS